MARKPTPPQLLALRGLSDQLALGGASVNAFSPFWRPLRLAGWLDDHGRVTAAGAAVLARCVFVFLTCDFCETRVADYVVDTRHHKVLKRKCRCCGARRAYAVTGHDIEVFGRLIE